MSERRYPAPPPPFEVLVEEREGYLYVCYAGRFDAAAARAAAARSGAVIQGAGHPWDLVSDFRNVEFLEPEVADVMIEAMQSNAPYVRRSALIGIHGAKRFIMELAAERAGRRELRVVRSLEEALAFLQLTAHSPATEAHDDDDEPDEDLDEP